MAVITGISALILGDGQGGKAALNIIQNKILRILSDTNLSYMTATLTNPADVRGGTVHYWVPEIIKADQYGTGTNTYDVPQVGTVSIPINTRRDVRYTFETFDISRLQTPDVILGQIASGVALAVQNDLNGHFLRFLANQFATGGDLEQKNQRIQLANLGATAVGNQTPDDFFNDYLTLEYLYAKINMIFDNKTMGIPKAEVMCLFSPFADIALRRAFRNQPNQIGTWQVTKTLQGRYIGNIKYFVDKMLQNNIPADSSFAKDIGFDLTKFIGFVFHNEAVAMPINFHSLNHMLDPQTANPLFLVKYQFGIGLLRPNLLYALTTDMAGITPFTLQPAKGKNKGQQQP